MKKYLILALAAVLFTLQSCTMTFDNTYHSDGATTILLNSEFKELLDTMGGEDKGEMEELNKLPKTWTSFYEMDQKDGGKTKDPDSIKLMKKMFVKGNFLLNDITGISIKMDHFTKADQELLAKLSKENTKDKMPLEMKNFGQWDGKNLVFDTKDFNMDAINKTLKGGEVDGMDSEQAKEMLKMMMKNYTMNLKFENEIKNINGKHDWVKQIDPKTVQINYDIENIDGSKLKNKDQKITITTK